MLLAISITLWLPYKRFDEARFDEVEPGMSPHAVRSLLGKPHRVVVDATGRESWYYRKVPVQYSMWDAEWRVQFQGGEVAETEVYDGW